MKRRTRDKLYFIGIVLIVLILLEMSGYDQHQDSAVGLSVQPLNKEIDTVRFQGVVEVVDSDQVWVRSGQDGYGPVKILSGQNLSIGMRVVVFHREHTVSQSADVHEYALSY